MRPMWRTWIQQDWGPYKKRWGASLQAPQWLELCVVSATGAGSVPGQRTKIPHAVQRGKKKVNINLQAVPCHGSNIY